MYKRIRTEIEVAQRELFHHPLMEQSLFSAIHEELEHFYKWIATLESQVIASHDVSSSQEKMIANGLTLRRLWVMIKEYEQVLCWIRILLEACDGN
jgi:hypothetical protein